MPVHLPVTGQSLSEEVVSTGVQVEVRVKSVVVVRGVAEVCDGYFQWLELSPVHRKQKLGKYGTSQRHIAAPNDKNPVNWTAQAPTLVN